MRTMTYAEDGSLVSDVTTPDDPLVVNAATLTDRAAAALAANATYLALATPTVAQSGAQVKLLTKDTNALIRLALGLLADISDTA